MCMVINRVCWKKLPEQLGLHCYAVSTHPDELVLTPPPKKILDPPVWPGDQWPSQRRWEMHVWKCKSKLNRQLLTYLRTKLCARCTDIWSSSPQADGQRTFRLQQRHCFDTCSRRHRQCWKSGQCVGLFQNDSEGNVSEGGETFAKT